MRGRLVTALGVLVVAAVAGVLAVSMGLIPAAEPEQARTERLDLAKAVDTSAPRARPSEPPPAPQLSVERFPLCRPPAEGARVLRVAVAEQREGLLVFCQGGYQLFTFELGSVPVRAQRIARFTTRGALPGGAAGGDFDADGVYDLALGVAPRRGVLHEPGAGAFWVRGRREGGYDAPRALAETATQAIAAIDLDGAPPTDLVLLTRGDLAAQRPGELWTFSKGPTLARGRVVAVGLDPRDLFATAGNEAGTRLLVVSGQPGAVTRVLLPRDPAAKPEQSSVALLGAQAFVRGAEGELPLVRTPSALLALTGEPALAVEPWASDANVGPAVRVGDAAEPRVLGALVHGVAELARGGETVRDELFLGEETRVHDLVPLAGPGARRVLALVESEGELAAMLVPPPPWEASATLVIEPRAVDDGHGFAEVPLD